MREEHIDLQKKGDKNRVNLFFIIYSPTYIIESFEKNYG